MRWIDSAAANRRSSRWWTAAALTLVTIGAVVLGVAACGGPTPTEQQPQALADKGTPYGDLLVPSLRTSVSDGAVGVSVDSPVTVSASTGVIGAVTLVNAQGRLVKGELDQDGVAWRSALSLSDVRDS